MNLPSLARWLLAVTCTAVLAAIAFTLQVSGALMIEEAQNTGHSSSNAGLVAVISLFLAAPCFFIGTILFGAPMAWAMTRNQLDRPLPTALAAGSLSTTVGALLLYSALGGGSLKLALALPLAGAVGGLTFREMTKSPTRPRQLPRARP